MTIQELLLETETPKGLDLLDVEDLTHDHKVDELPEGFREKAFDWCKFHLASWRSLDISRFEIEVIRGGLTNLLFKCKVKNPSPEITPPVVLLRVYGEGTESFFSRFLAEISFVVLSERNVGPKLYGIFMEGRLEQFFDARTLKTKDLIDKDIAVNIAKSMAKFHETDMPIDKTPVCDNNLINWTRTASVVLKKGRSSEGDIQIHRSISQSTQEFSKGDSEFIRYLYAEDLPHEVEWYIKEVIPKIKTPIRYCHNDVNAGNVMAFEDGKLQLIDFEYANYNYVTYDIANMFCERVFDYHDAEEYPFYFKREEQFPTLEEQRVFVTHYLEGLNIEITEKTMKQYLVDINYMLLAAHMLWALWSVIQSECSKIDFPYLQYAVVRYEKYKEAKANLPKFLESLEKLYN